MSRPSDFNLDPNLQEVLDRWKRKRIGGFKGPVLLLMVVGLLWILSGFYIVSPGEQGVIRRFGRFVRITTSGPRYHLPWPIETVDTPNVQKIQREEIGFRTISAGPPARYMEVPEESDMLTGDENIVDVEFTVQYRIKDAGNYLFKVRGPQQTLRHVSEAAMRQVVGNRGIDEALTIGKAEIQRETADLIQSTLDRYGSGIKIETVQLQDVNPPKEVLDAFRDVARAREDKNRLINQAEAYQNDIVPKARGDAERTIREAEAYRETRVRRSQGDADRFLEVLREYRKAPSVTEKRLYIETMEAILPNIQKYIVKSDGGLINLLQLQGKMTVPTRPSQSQGGGKNR